MDPRTLIDGIEASFVDESGKLSLAQQMKTLGLGGDAPVGPLLHTLEAERELIAVANDIGREAAAKLPGHFAFCTKWRGRCVDVTVATGDKGRDGNGGVRGANRKTPLILRTKDPQLLAGMKHFQMNIEATIEVWNLMLSRLEESLHHWQYRMGTPLENVVEDRVQFEMRMDLESAKTRVMYSIQHMQSVLEEAMEIVEGIERGQGEGRPETAIGRGQRQGSDEQLPEQEKKARQRSGEGMGRGRK